MSNAELRYRARCALGGNIFAAGWLYPVLFSVLVSLVTGFTSAFIVGIIVIGLIMLGNAKYYLYLNRGMIRSDGFNVALDGIKNDPKGTVLLGILYNIFLVLWTLLFIIPGIVESYSYAMAFYIKADHPEYSAEQAITESRILMQGNKLKLFMLDLSFIGWILLGSLCFGIGVLWVVPYMESAHAEFYRDLVGG